MGLLLVLPFIALQVDFFWPPRFRGHCRLRLDVVRELLLERRRGTESSLHLILTELEEFKKVDCPFFELQLPLYSSALSVKTDAVSSNRVGQFQDPGYITLIDHSAARVNVTGKEVVFLIMIELQDRKRALIKGF